MAFKFQLGVYVKDRLTGLTGVIAARTDHLAGCNQYIVQPYVDADGKLSDAFWIDEATLEVDETKQRFTLERAEAEPPG